MGYYLSFPRIPNLSGCVCTAFFAEETLRNGRINNSLNAFYLQVNDNGWHRFQVNCMGVKWKSVRSPQHPTMDGWQFHLVAIEEPDIIGRRIQWIDYAEREPFGEEPDPDAADRTLPWGYEESVIRFRFTDCWQLEVWYREHEIEMNLIEICANHMRQKKTPRRGL